MEVEPVVHVERERDRRKGQGTTSLDVMELTDRPDLASARTEGSGKAQREGGLRTSNVGFSK